MIYIYICVCVYYCVLIFIHHIKNIKVINYPSKLGYAVPGGLWRAAPLLSLMVATCISFPILCASAEVCIFHSHVINVASRVSSKLYQRSIKGVFQITSTCYQRSIMTWS